jgi:pimeloyl-ACP methyl ester carboxylesterase
MRVSLRLIAVRWARSYPLAPRYHRPTLPLRLRSADGTLLAAWRVPGPSDAVASVVVVHGFTNSSRSPEIHRLVDALSLWAHVLALDLRGHGGSGGRSTLGAAEPDDVNAAIRAAVAFAPNVPVVVVGISLGGISSLVAAGRYGTVAGVVAISAPAWRDFDSPAGARAARWLTSRRGRAILRVWSGTKVDSTALAPEDLEAAVRAVAPAFVVVVHDPDERVFGPEHARALQDWAGPSSSLWWVPGGGHGRSMLTDELAGRLQEEIRSRLAPVDG